jgi:hypothetical protein
MDERRRVKRNNKKDKKTPIPNLGRKDRVKTTTTKQKNKKTKTKKELSTNFERLRIRVSGDLHCDSSLYVDLRRNFDVSNILSHHVELVQRHRKACAPSKCYVLSIHKQEQTQKTRWIKNGANEIEESF